MATRRAPIAAASRHSSSVSDDHISTISSMSELSSVPSRDRSPAREVVIDQAEVLRQINQYRSEHGAAPLKWSTTCATRAQERASQKAGASPDFGENLARSTDARWGGASFACAAAIQHWLKEESRYDYDKPGLSTRTDNFTNIVWKLTTHVGFGVRSAEYKGRVTFFAAAFFFPKGNQPGDFRRNVLPMGSVYDGDEFMVKLAAPTPRNARDARERTTPHCVRVTTVNTEVRDLRSPDGRFLFQLLPDRNIVVSRKSRLVWESGSKSLHPVSAPFRLVLQKNGDMVAYDSSSRAFWSTETANCGPGPFTLAMQDDGHCVLYDGGWKARWATNSKSQ